MMAAETPSSIKNQNISGTKQAVMQMLNNASAHSLEESNTSNLVVKKKPIFFFQNMKATILQSQNPNWHLNHPN